MVPLATGVDIDWRQFTLVIGAESSDFWRPLGIAIISGLSVSTFLTLVVVPTFYSYFEDVGNAFGRLRNRKSPIKSQTDFFLNTKPVDHFTGFVFCPYLLYFS